MEELEEFGRAVIREVRDSSVQQWMRIVEGRMRGATATAARSAILEAASCEEAINAVLPDVVNTVLHRFMELLESEKITIRWNGVEFSEMSDGLAGELATPKGWIARFSETPLGKMAE